MARMMGKNFRRRGPCHRWCSPEERPFGRAREARLWRADVSSEADFNHKVDEFQVPGWCPFVGPCPDWCGHSGVYC